MQIYLIIAGFCKFQKLFKKTKAKELPKERSKGADVNEGKFVLNIDVLFVIYISSIKILNIQIDKYPMFSIFCALYDRVGNTMYMNNGTFVLVVSQWLSIH